MIDIGVNLTNERFQGIHAQVIEEAKTAGVPAIIITGTDIEHSSNALAITKQFDNLYSTAGIHPHDASSFNQHSVEQLTSILSDKNVVAIGETGLDFNRNFSTPEQQIHAFEKQLELGEYFNKPFFLHEREAFDTQYRILKNAAKHFHGGVLHCFTGSQRELEGYLDLGLYIGITGWICDERRGTALRSLLKDIPDDRLLIETDSPYLTPRTLQGKARRSKNQPCHLPHIAEHVALARNQSLEHIKTITTKNTKSLFHI